jgi:hypothetical protein
VSIFSRKPRLVAANVADDWVDSRAWVGWDPPRNMIRGESHYQPAIRRLCGMSGMPRRQGYLRAVCIDLVREPANKYDSNALAARVENLVVGYLGREFAAQLAPVLDKHKIRSVRVCGVIRGGTPTAPSLGVHIWLDRRPCEGPGLIHADSVHVVAWPPFDGEGAD